MNESLQKCCHPLGIDDVKFGQSYPNTPPTEHHSEDTGCWGEKSSPLGSQYTVWMVRTTDTASGEESAHIHVYSNS